MATIVLSAVGTALGGAMSTQLFGLSTAVIGRAVGATIGRVIDQRIMGSGSETVETGKVDRFRRTVAVRDLDPALEAKVLEIADKCPVHRTLCSEMRITTERVDD